jgi:hypothetical protein
VGDIKRLNPGCLAPNDFGSPGGVTMLPPPPISAPRLPGMADGTAFTTGSEAVQPGRTKASLRGTGEARVERARSRGGYGGGSLESGASPRSGRKSTDGEVSLWDNTTGSDDTSETELRQRHDDPAMEDDVLGDVGARPKMRMRKSNASAGSKKTKTPPQHEPTPHERWEAVRAKVKIVGKVQADSLNSKHYGVELDMSSSFGTSRDDNAVPPVTRLLFINPDGKFRSGWDITQVLVLFYLAWVTPYRVLVRHRNHHGVGQVRVGAFPNPADCLMPLFECTTRNIYQYWQQLHTSQVHCLPIQATCTLKTDTFFYLS